MWQYDTGTGYESLTFYGADGRRMADYEPVQRASDWVFIRGGLQVYFAGKRLAIEDRLGSDGNGDVFPYGTQRNGAVGPSFATYKRDSTLDLDYAINRWYMPGKGRFTTADPYRASGGPAKPASWNRYRYAAGDPANFFDEQGLQEAGEPGPSIICLPHERGDGCTDYEVKPKGPSVGGNCTTTRYDRTQREKGFGRTKEGVCGQPRVRNDVRSEF